MDRKLTARLATVGMFVSFSPLHAQRNLAYVPAEQQTADFPDREFGDRNSSFDQFDRMFPRESTPRPSRYSGAGTVSVDRLRHPLSDKGRQLIDKGQRFAAAGEHQKAMEQFRNASSEPTAVFYAHGLLGTEYLKTGNIASAVEELVEAVGLMPGEAAIRSNLGYALFLTGQSDRAERQLREAIKLDHTATEPRYVLGLLLLDKRSEEAGNYLLFAKRLFSRARLALAILYTRAGETDAAAQEVRAYLGSESIDKARDAERWVRLAAQMERPSQLFAFSAEVR